MTVRIEKEQHGPAGSLKSIWWRLHDGSLGTELSWRIRKIRRTLSGERSPATLPYKWDALPSRWQLIQELIDRHRYMSYLEIGCAGNACFDRIGCERKVGVDPESGGTVRKTSDEFFRDNREAFDCVFIDGLHTYEQVRRDLDNSLSVLRTHGVILLHDCVPCSIEEQAMPREQLIWTGDVWKAIVERRTQRDVDTAVCLIDRGIGVVLKRPNSEPLVLPPHTDFAQLSYEQYAENHLCWMRTMDYTGTLAFVGTHA
jgi:hypothetical protein